MKVIERASEEWDKVVPCPECRSTLEVELADLTRVCGSDQRSAESWDYATFKCPVCTRTVAPKGLLERIPLHLRNLLGRARRVETRDFDAVSDLPQDKAHHFDQAAAERAGYRARIEALEAEVADLTHQLRREKHSHGVTMRTWEECRKERDEARDAQHTALAYYRWVTSAAKQYP